MKRMILAAIAASSMVAATATAATAATKTKTVVPTPGKACKASDVGAPIVGLNRALLGCVKSGASYKWQISASSVTSAPATTAVVTTAPAATTAAAGSAATTAPTTPATVAAKSEKWPDKLVLAIVPGENATITLGNWSPFAKGLEKELGVKIELVTPSDYAGVVEAQLSGKADLGLYGPFSYYVAKQAGAKIEPIAVTVSQIGNPATYQSFLITKADSPINTIADLKGKKVCFVDTLSTSGFLYPISGLKDAGIDYQKDITAVFAGTHDKSVAAVKSGTCDAGFAFDDMVTKTAVTAGIIKATDIKIIWKSKGIPQGPIAVRTGLPDSLLVKIRQVLPNIDALYLQANKLCPDATPTCNLGGPSNSWAPVNDSFFDPIADVCKATQAAACFPPKR